MSTETQHTETGSESAAGASENQLLEFGGDWDKNPEFNNNNEEEEEEEEEEKPAGTENDANPNPDAPKAEEEGKGGEKKPEPAGKKEEPKAETVQVPDFSSQLVKETNGKIKSKEDLEQYLSRPDLSKHPEVAVLYDHLEKGGTYESYNQIKSLGDVKAMDDREAVRKLMHMEFPDWTPDEIEFKLSRKYPTDVEGLDPDDVREMNLNLKAEGKEARQKLTEKINSLANPPASKEKETREAAEAKAKKDVEDWHNYVAKGVENFSKIEVPVEGEKEPFIYELKPEEKKLVHQFANEAWKNSEIWVEAGKDEAGKFSMPRMLTAIAMALKAPTILPKIAQNGMARGIESVKKSMQNTQEVGGKTTTSGSGKDDENWEYAFARSMNLPV